MAQWPSRNLTRSKQHRYKAGYGRRQGEDELHGIPALAKNNDLLQALPASLTITRFRKYEDGVWG